MNYVKTESKFTIPEEGFVMEPRESFYLVL